MIEHRSVESVRLRSEDGRQFRCEKDLVPYPPQKIDAFKFLLCRFGGMADKRCSGKFVGSITDGLIVIQRAVKHTRYGGFACTGRTDIYLREGIDIVLQQQRGTC